jgi:hypothetical protein
MSLQYCVRAHRLPLHNERFWEVGKGVICTVTEALKGGPYRLCWQKLLGCELLANQAGCLSIRAHVTLITYHTVHVEPTLYGTKSVSLVRTEPSYWYYNINKDKERIKNHLFTFVVGGRPRDAASRFGYLFQLQEAAPNENHRLEDWPLM